jgi:hypothetical protein
LAAACTLLAALAVGAGTALASQPSTTLSGSARGGVTPDSSGFSTIAVDATLAQGAVSGTLETGGRTGGPGDDSHYQFSGDVTCMLVQANRVIVGAYGTVAFHEEVEGREVGRPLFGPYMQVAVVEFVEPHGEQGPGGEFTVSNEWQSLGEHHQGLPSYFRPKCSKYAALEAFPFGTPIDSLALSPSITRPTDGYTSPSSSVALAGRGEPFSTVEVFEVGHKAKATIAFVNPSGAWALTLRGLSSGSHEYVALATEGSPVPSNTVRFAVS